jgi:uncharacterized protein DUF2625
VSAASALGALALNCGGMLIDRGWLRMLGAGCTGLPDLATANGLDDSEVAVAPGVLTVAYDVLAAAASQLMVETCRQRPVRSRTEGAADTLDWTPIGGGHSTFVQWALGGGLADFYQHLRWPGWQGEVSRLTPDFGIAVYPPLFSVEGREPSYQIRQVPPGTQFRVGTTDDY